MDIFGIGGWELVAIFLLMLIFAGPKRMLQWSYVAGQWAARLRALWSQAAGQLQAELDQAGVDVRVPRQLPNRAVMERELQRQWSLATPPPRPAAPTPETPANADIPRAS